MPHRSSLRSVRAVLRHIVANARWPYLALLATLAALGNVPAQAGVAAPTCDWTGGSSTTSQWSDAANWNNCAGAHPVPVDGDIVRFPAGAARRSNQNDLIGLDLLQIVFTGANYVLSGNGVTVGGLLSSNVTALTGSDAGPGLGLPLTLAANTTLVCTGNRGVQVGGPVTLAGFDLVVQGSCDSELAGALSGAGTLHKQGLAVLTLSATGGHAGAILAQAGVLVLRANPGSTAVQVAAGASLRVETDTTFNAALQLVGTGSPGIGTLAAFNGLPNWAGPITVSNGARIEVDGSAILTLSGAIVGGGGLTKTGVGQLVLNGSANTYADGTTLLAGDVLVLSNGGLGAAGFPVVVSDDAMLELEADVYSNRPLVLNGAGLLGIGALRSRGADVVWSGPVTLASDAAIGGQLNTTLALSGVVSGPGSLTHAGLNDLILSAANTYTGATQINAGTLLIRHAAALGAGTAGTVVANGGTLAVDGPLVIAEPLVLNGIGNSGALRMLDDDNAWTAPITLALANTVINTGPGTFTPAALDGAGGLQKVGTGTLVLNSGNSYAGLTYITDGVLRVEHPNALGAAGSAAAGVDMSSGATLQLAGVTINDEHLSLWGSGTGGIGGLHAATGVNVWNGPIDIPALPSIGVAAGSELSIPAIVSGNGSGLYKRGEGTLILGGANTYAGTTIVFDGVLRLAHAQALGAADATTVGFGARIELSGALAIGNETLSIQGTGPDGGGALLSSGTHSWAGAWMLNGETTVAVPAGSLSLTGGIPTMAPTLTKTGAGTLRYGGGAYTAPVFINAGVLDLAADAIAVIVHVNETGTLSGSGNANFVTLKDGGTVAPSGTLGMANLFWQGGTIALRLGPAALGSDRLAVSGAVDKSGDGDWFFRFSDAPAGPPLPGVTYALVGFGGTSFATGDFDYTYNGVDGRSSLPGTILVGSNQFSLVPFGVSLYRDGFEDAPP
jgi:fibronectin-binding autotransporter adhesin